VLIPDEELNAVTGKIIAAAIAVHRVLGPGLLESTYAACLCVELRKAQLRHDRQVRLPIVYDGVVLDVGYRLDLIVERLVIVEVKALNAWRRSTARSS
jgi:GxxExxY protein